MTIDYNIATDIPAEIFRAYDIRGIVDQTFIPNNIYTIGIAIGSELQDRGKKQLAIARDGRLSGPSLLSALEAGLMASGCDVVNLGEVTTPILYYATATMDFHSGVMLTGSHNPPEYNGIKMVLAGETLYGEAILKLHQRITTNNLKSGQGKTTHLDLIETYLKRILSDVKLAKPLKIVIDCGNGVGGKVAPQLFRKLGCQVIELFCNVDGHFPNHHPDPSIPKNLQDLIAAVKKNNADIGFAFDGDADRIGVITNQGEIIGPDRLMMFLAIDLLSRFPGAVIPFDVKCSRYLAEQITQHGGKPLMYKTGHSLIKAKMKEIHALLAGEYSGHIFMKERWYGFDDAIYVAARLTEIIAQSQQTSSERFATLPSSINTPELKITMADDKKFGFMEKLVNEANFADGKVTTIDGIRVDFTDGFGLIRPSNTTPALILRFEGDNEAALKRIENIFKQQLLALDSSLELPF